MKMMAEDADMAEDQITDNNKIEQLLNIGYGFKILKLVIIILNFSYLIAMFWYILCKSIEDFWLGVDYQDEATAEKY